MLNLALMLMSKRMHGECSKAVSRLKARLEGQYPAYIENVRNWSSVFSGISIITNRSTPSHLDDKGYNEGFDLLLTGGTYSNAVLKLEDLGAELAYAPGTLIAICGRVLKHGVESWDCGDRICYAHFVRDDVLSSVGCQRAPLVNLSEFSTHMKGSFPDQLLESAISFMKNTV